MTEPADAATRPEVAFGPPAAPNEVGTLGPYRVVRQLGKGGMGAVYLAIDTRLNRNLALKVMLPQCAADRAARERFLREARAAAQISHDNVVTVYEADERTGVPYIAMQFLQGYSLDEYLAKKGTPTVPQVVRLGREAALGLAAAHKIGLVHRDVKPANLWLEAPNGRVRVLDFGLAKPVDADVEVTGSGVVVGTPAYMSPEQARGEKVDARADLFSLGAVLYRLCTGRLPFEGPNVMAVLTALAVEDPRPVRGLNPAVPEPLADLIHQLLAKDPAARPQTADEVARRLRAMADELAVPTALAAAGPGGSGALQVTAVPEANPFEDLDAALDDSAALPASKVRAGREPSRWWVWVAGVAVLVVIGVVLGVLATRKGGAERKKGPPDGVAQTAPDTGGKSPAPLPFGKPAPVVEAERKAAEWVLSAGGFVRVNGEDREVRAAADLPKGRFTVTSVSLYSLPFADTDLSNLSGLRGLQSLNLEGTRVTDAGLVHIRDLTGLSDLRLKGTRVTNAGLVHLRNLTRLRDLTLAGTEVSDGGLEHVGELKGLVELGLDGTSVRDAGLAHLTALPNLKKIWLNDTQITDAGLKQLAGLSGLERLLVQRTQVTATGVAAFQAAVPGCAVEWDGGTVEPKK